MKSILWAVALTIITIGHAMAAPVIGEPAPDFTGTDSKGVTRTLSDYKGKIVILEWTNHECPYVGKHYSSGNMQSLQKQATDDGVIWLSIVSSAEGKQGYTTPKEAEAIMTEVGSNATARILDPTGAIGSLYEAKTTPHMFVIDTAGILVYQGAIDDDPKFSKDGIADAHNYVKAAWQAVMAGKPVEVPSTHSYGCSIKY